VNKISGGFLMKKIFATLISLFLFVSIVPQVFADGCYLCGSGSTNGCQQCRYGGSDTQAQRQACADKGCKVSGTASCSSAANVKVCSVEVKKTFEDYLTYAGK
jgi:hypothetical protein